MSWEMIGFMTILTLAILAVIFRKNPFVRKYWKYLLILVPGAIVLILKILRDYTTKPKTDQSSQSLTVKDQVQEIKEQIIEVQTIAKIETTVVRTKNDAMMQELKEVQSIKDDRERRRRLAAMIG